MPDDALNRAVRTPARDRWIFGGVIALLLWAPLPAASTPAAATAFLGLCIALLVLFRLVLVLRGAALPPLPRPASAVLVLWLAWVCWTALYAVPLPPALLDWLSPASHAAHVAVAAAGSSEPLFTLSILPGATLQQLGLSAAYAGLFWLVLVCSSRNRVRQRRLLLAIVLSGLIQALYGSVMMLSGLEYAFMGPKTFGFGRATGTFVNQNHLAGYLQLALAAGIALVLADLRPAAPRTWRQTFAGLVELAMSRRLRIRVMLAIMVVGLVLTKSRGGNAAFFVALALCGSAFVLVRHPKYFGKTLLFFLSLFLVDLLIVSEQYGLDNLAQRFEATRLESEQRTLALRDLQPLLIAHGLAGSGPGSFAAAFSPHRSPELIGHFDHAHNDHLEFIIESGVIGYALLGGIAVITLAHGLAVIRRRRDPIAAALAFAGCMGLVSLLIHGLADFNLRIPAVAATLIALIALTLSCSSTSTAQRAPDDPP